MAQFQNSKQSLVNLNVHQKRFPLSEEEALDTLNNMETSLSTSTAQILPCFQRGSSPLSLGYELIFLRGLSMEKFANPWSTTHNFMNIREGALKSNSKIFGSDRYFADG